MNKDEIKNDKVTNRTVIPLPPQCFHFREPLLNNRSDELPCPSNLKWKFGDNS